MKRNTSLFAVLALAAIVAVVPAANAQTVHYLGAGSSAMFNGFAVAAFNDLATGVAPGGIIHSAACTASGVTCTANHWSISSNTAQAVVRDVRNAAIPDEGGNLWVVWVNCTAVPPAVCPAGGANGNTDVWAYISIDSTVGVREFLGRTAGGSAATLQLLVALQAVPGANKVNHLLFTGGAADNAVGLPADVQTALSGKPISAGMTDIRMEDALQATLRILGNCPAAGCNNAGEALVANTCPLTDTGIPSGVAIPCNDFPYYQSFTLGYGNGTAAQVGTQIQSHFTTTKATPVSFALPGFADPFSAAVVPATITTFPVGEAPIILITNRKNSAGVGQIIGNIPPCNGLDNNTDSVYCVNDPPIGPGGVAGGGTGYTSDGSYLIRNVWDMHPFPAVVNRFSDLVYSPANAGSGLCAGTGVGTGACKMSRRPLESLFAGNMCETASTAFTWPLDSALEGNRPVLPAANNVAVNPILREPLSGTYNTFEYTESRRFGGTQGNFSWNGSAWINIPYLSQENDAPGDMGAPYNPLNEQCPVAFQDPGIQGFRMRGVGTGEVVAASSGAGGVYGTVDSIGYLFFSFGNVNPNVGTNPPMPRNVNYGYLTIDGVDGLFQDYSASGTVAVDPGQPAVHATPTTWGELPNCTPGGGVGLIDCKANAIWDTTHACAGGAINAGGCSYPHLRDGTYPAWSELRLMCDTADPHCTITNDANGAQALVENLQADIHFNNLGGVPDLLPMSDAAAGALSFNPPYGDVAFIRDHSANLAAGTAIPGGGPALPSAYNSFIMADDNEDLFHQFAPYLSTLNPQTIHQTLQTTPAISSGMPALCGGGAGTNSPPAQECGGDVGGFVIPAPGNVVTTSHGQLQ